jgi:hypothetical protein
MKTDKKSYANLTADIKAVREEKAGMESEPSVETEEDKAKDKKEELPVITRSTTETNRRPPTIPKEGAELDHGAGFSAGAPGVI